MAKKIRKIIDGKIKWFGSGGQAQYNSPMLTVDNDEAYIESYKYQIYNLLNIVRGELLDKTYGIKGVFGKKSKEDLDLEITSALTNKLDVIVSSYYSEVVDRQYRCEFTVVTPKGTSISLEVTL